MTGDNSMERRGFTLMEIMVVMLIIAVLAAVAIPMYQDYTKKTKAAEAWEELSNIASLQEQIFTDLRQYDTDGSRLPAYGATFQGKYFSVEVNGTNVWTAAASVCFDGRKPCSLTDGYDYMFTIDRSGYKTTKPNGANVYPGWKL